MGLWALVLVLGASPVIAQDARFCPNRPSLGESGCTTERGHVQFEVSAIDWELDSKSDERQDSVLVGDFQARFGLGASSELQIAWRPYGHVRTRDKTTGLIDQAGRLGDVQIGVRQNLRNPDGKGLSFAIQPSVTLPVGRTPVGAGTWGVGLVMPLAYDLSEAMNLALTSGIYAAPNEDGSGRHFALNEVIGLGYDLTEQLTGVAELELVRDNDPSGHATQVMAAGSIAWQPQHGLQFDMMVGAGLNREAPTLRIATGGAVLF